MVNIFKTFGHLRACILGDENLEQMGIVTNPIRTKSDSQQGAFGEQLNAELSPQIQLQFPYNINSRQLISFPGNGGGVVNGNEHANVNTGTSSDGFAFMTSRDVLKYNSGQGALARFTALFTAGVISSEQIIGLGGKEDGYFVGYNGADFGFLRRNGGTPEVRILTITTPSTTDEDITITLDGTAVTDVTVTNSGDADITAREIAAHNFASVDDGWAAGHAGNTVIFVSISPEPLSGSYSLSGAATAAGTFAQSIAGVVPTDTWVNQEDWNIDGMGANSLNPSGMTLDQTKGNVYQIRYQWLGYGAITLSIENMVTGQYQDVHTIRYANTNTTPSTGNPTFRLFMSVRNTGNTSDLTLKSSSMAAFIEGREIGLGPAFSADNLFVISVTTEEPVVTIRNKFIYQGAINRVRSTVLFVTLVSNLAAVQGNTTFRIYKSATPENGTSYSDIEANGSTTEIDSSAVDFDTTEAEKLFTFILGQEESRVFDLANLRDRLHPGETIMITAQPSKANAANEVGASINWRELF